MFNALARKLSASHSHQTKRVNLRFSDTAEPQAIAWRLMERNPIKREHLDPDNDCLPKNVNVPRRRFINLFFQKFPGAATPMFRHAIGVIFLLAVIVAMTGPARADEPVRVIFDTDITGDVDDVLALAMLHTLADRGECVLEAVTVSKVHPLTAPFVDAVNTFYGRPDIPIGVTRNSQHRDSKYLNLVQQRDEGRLRYPHDLMSSDDAPEAVAVLRETLARAEDGSLVLIQVGLATNLAELVQSPPDAISALSGRELVRQKVRLVSVMAGAFSPIRGDSHYLEANVRNGISAMQQFAASWPQDVPVVWSDFQIGISAPYPRESIARDFQYEEHHIVREAYLLHSGPNHDRPTWDLTSVLHAVRPDENYFTLSQRGNVSVEDDGFTKIDFTPNGRDRFLKMNAKQTIRVIETQRALVSQPPKCVAGD